MPVEHIAVGSLAIPTPFHLVPESCDGLPNLALGRVFTVEILARREKSLDQERRLHEVASVVVLAKIGNRLAAPAIEEMRPRPMEPVGLRKEADDSKNPVGR